MSCLRSHTLLEVMFYSHIFSSLSCVFFFALPISQNFFFLKQMFHGHGTVDIPRRMFMIKIGHAMFSCILIKILELIHCLQATISYNCTKDADDLTLQHESSRRYLLSCFKDNRNIDVMVKTLVRSEAGFSNIIPDPNKTIIADSALYQFYV